MKRMSIFLLIVFVATGLMATTVCGRCLGSDNLDVGIEGARVDLTGYNSFTEYTDADGYFYFEWVTENQTYEIRIRTSGYEEYNSEVFVEYYNIDLGDIVITYIPPQPIQLVATESSDYQSVTLNWSIGNGDMTEFRYDDGIITGQLGYAGGGEDVRLGAAHFCYAEIYSVKWYLTDEGGPHNAVDLYIYGLDGSGLPDTNDELFSATSIGNTDLEWNTLELDETISAPNGFFICLNYPVGFLGLGTDDGSGDPYEYISGTQWVTNAASSNDWHDPDEYGYPLNFAIRAEGLNYGEIEYDARQSERSDVAREMISEAPVYFGGFQMPEVATTRLDRPDSTYHITFYRFYEDDADDPSQWIYLGEGDYTYPDTTFVDETWDDAEWGEHQWAAAYQSEDGNTTGTIFSNVMPRIYCPVYEVHVSTNSGESAAGAYVNLENIDGDENHVYEAFTNEDGIAFFYPVWLGIYTLSVSLDGFDDYFQENVLIEDLQGEEYYVELTETLLPVTIGEGYVDGNDLFMCWYPPNDPPDLFYYEDFEEGVVPEDWIVLDEDEDGYTWEIIPEDWEVYEGEHAIGSASYINEIGPLYPDNWLITPPLEINGNTQFSFWLAGQDPDWVWDHYAVRLSTTGIAPEDFTELLFEETLEDAGWHQVVLDLSEYSGSTCHVAFNHCDCVNMYWIKLDCIEFITEESTVSLTRNAVKERKQVPAPGDRSLLGYKITRNGQTLVELQTETEYWDMNLSPGDYTYGIFAVYTTGEAAPFWFYFGGATNEGGISEYSNMLLGNSPNPFNPVTRIGFSLAQDSHVVIEVFNVRGQRVKLLTDDLLKSGGHDVTWQGDDDAGNIVSSSIYFYRMKVDGKPVGVKKMMMMK